MHMALRRMTGWIQEMEREKERKERFRITAVFGLKKKKKNPVLKHG